MMIATLKETWASIKDLEHGPTIIKMTVGQVFWYWFKYVLAICLVLVVLALAGLTYFIPQTSKLAERILPDIDVTLKDGLLSTTVAEPLVLKGKDFTFMLNTQGKEEDADSFTNGVLVLQDRAIVKSEVETRIIKFSEIKDNFTIDKQSIVSWLTENKLTLLTYGLVLVLVACVLSLGVYVISKWLGFLIGAILLLVVAKITNRKVDFADTLKLAIYAAVPALWLSVILTFLPNSISPLLTLAVWAFYASAWLVKLPVSKK